VKDLLCISPSKEHIDIFMIGFIHVVFWCNFEIMETFAQL